MLERPLFFRLLNGMIKPTAGRIIINNQDFTKLKGRKKRDIQKTIGTIYQDFCLVDTITCLDNVLNGALADRNAFQALLGIFTKEQKEYARKQLEAVGLSEKNVFICGKTFWRTETESCNCKGTNAEA